MKEFDELGLLHSIFTNGLIEAPISLERSIPAMMTSYSTWLLLDLNSNLMDHSMRILFGPSSTTPTLLCFKFKVSSTDNV